MKRNQKLAALVLAALPIIFSGGVVQAAVTELAEVVVEGSRYDADIAQTSPVASGMVGTENDVGILGHKDVLDMPVQQMTFTKEAMKTFSQPGRSIMDTLALDPSVTVTHGATDTSISIRGFSASSGAGSWIVNGIPSMGHQMTMPYNFIDKVSVLSGPNIGVNGTGVFMATSVGGTVSVTTKKAQDTPNLSATLSWTSDSYFTESIDWGKRFGKNNEWGVRVNAQAADGDLAVDGVADRKRDIYVNIDHRAKRSKTNLFMGYDYDNLTGRSNTIQLGDLTSLPRVPKNTNNLSPKWSNDQYENYTFILNHEQYLKDNLTWFANAGYRKEDYPSWLQQWSSRKLLDTDGNYSGTYTQMPVFHKYYYFNTGFKGNFMLGSLKNEWAASVDYTYFKRSRVNGVSDANKYNITGNIYTGAHSAKPDIFWDPITKQYNTRMKGWTVADTVSTADGRAAFTFGWHGHSVETTNYVGAGSHLKTDATAPILGLVYKITPDFTFYANHTENFGEGTTVGSSYDNENASLPPTKTKQNEFGFKYKTGSVLNTLSFYEIKKENAIAVPSSGPKGQIYALDGEQRNRGIEYSAAGDIGDKWSVIFGIAYMDAKQTKTKGGLNDGRRVEVLPKWAADLALIYKPNDNVRVTGRVSYTGSELIRNSSSYTQSIRLPSSTLVDLGVAWDTHFGRQPVTLSAFCYNLFDKEYWYASGSNAIGLGSPRTFAVTAQFDF